jgi:hypothetical protein
LLSISKPQLSSNALELSRMGRTILPWRMIVEAEVERLKKFRETLRLEDKLIFDDLLRQCKLYASAASSLTSPVKEVPLIMSILFAHHKKLTEIEKRLDELAHV